MKIKTTQSDLKTALAKLANVVPPRPAVPILSCVKIEGSPDGKGVSLLGTDTNVTVKTTLSCDVEKPAVALVSYGVLSAVVNASAPGDVELDTSSGKFRVVTPSGVTNLSLNAEELYPPVTREDGERRVITPGDDLSRAFSQVEYAIASKAEGRPALENTLLEVVAGKARAVATNGKALAVATVASDVRDSESGPLRLLVPDAATKVVQRLLGDDDVEILVPPSRKYAVFAFGDAVVKTKLGDHEYPNYSRVIPSDEGDFDLLAVNAQELVGMIRRATIIGSASDVHCVMLNIASSGITVSSQSENIGDFKGSVAVEGYNGKAIKLRFDPGLLCAALSSVQGEKVEMHVHGEFSPLKIKDGDTYLAVAMPLRIA